MNAPCGSSLLSTAVWSPTRRLRPLPTALLLAASAAALAGCVGVTIEPMDPSWTETGGEDAPQAAWCRGDVEIVVPLRYDADETHFTADVQNRGPEPARLTFASPGGIAAPIPLGRASGGPPTFEDAWSETVYPGRPVEIPAGVPDRPGTVRFALLPDARWGPDGAPPLGSRITLDATLATSAGSVSCRFRFEVTGSPEAPWSGLGTTGRWLVLVLMAAVAAAAAIWCC